MTKNTIEELEAWAEEWEIPPNGECFAEFEKILSRARSQEARLVEEIEKWLNEPNPANPKKDNYELGLHAGYGAAKHAVCQILNSRHSPKEQAKGPVPKDLWSQHKSMIKLAQDNSLHLAANWAVNMSGRTFSEQPSGGDKGKDEGLGDELRRRIENMLQDVGETDLLNKRALMQERLHKMLGVLSRHPAAPSLAESLEDLAKRKGKEVFQMTAIIERSRCAHFQISDKWDGTQKVITSTIFETEKEARAYLLTLEDQTGGKK